MTAKIISGKDIAERILDAELKPRVEALNAKGVEPKLVVILIGEHPASASYVRQKEKFAERCGIVAETWRFEDTITELEVLAEIEKINNDDSIHGVIVQLPVPDHVSGNYLSLSYQRFRRTNSSSRCVNCSRWSTRNDYWRPNTKRLYRY